MNSMNDSAATTPKVTMYTTRWCGSCRLAKSYLASKGIAFAEIDIETSPGAAQLVERWSGGYRTVPTIVIGDRVVVDWDRRSLDEALMAINDI